MLGISGAVNALPVERFAELAGNVLVEGRALLKPCCSLGETRPQPGVKAL
ncbi:MAG TPA: hypothetical protein VFS25_12020 [Chitinophaga sp.]|nr:hypothetical protein [Chitinophaga sp.]HEU4553560.1 hypothetical protein [Chitinophaga sp.]